MINNAQQNQDMQYTRDHEIPAGSYGSDCDLRS